jgi:drug/metabolite transporter (DMT)-like permease
MPADHHSALAIHPAEVVLVRLALGALVLVPIVYAGGGRLPKDPRVWGHLAVAALFANVVPYLLFAYGEQQVESAITGVLNATTSLWTILIASAVGLEKRGSPAKLSGIALGFVGAVVIFAPWRLGSQIMSWGGVACLLATASYGVSFVYMARFLIGRSLGPLSLAASQLIVATLLTALAAPFLGLRLPAWRGEALLAVTILGAIGTGIAYLLNYRLIVDEGASPASTVIYLLPVVAVVLGVTVLGEALPFNVIAGMAIVLASVALVRRGPAPEKEPVPGPTL